MREFNVCINVMVLGIESYVRYFLGIMDIIGFCDFVIFLIKPGKNSIFLKKR